MINRPLNRANLLLVQENMIVFTALWLVLFVDSKSSSRLKWKCAINPDDCKCKWEREWKSHEKSKWCICIYVYIYDETSVVLHAVLIISLFVRNNNLEWLFFFVLPAARESIPTPVLNILRVLYKHFEIFYQAVTIKSLVL